MTIATSARGSRNGEGMPASARSTSRSNGTWLEPSGGVIGSRGGASASPPILATWTPSPSRSATWFVVVTSRATGSTSSTGAGPGSRASCSSTGSPAAPGSGRRSRGGSPRPGAGRSRWTSAATACRTRRPSDGAYDLDDAGRRRRRGRRGIGRARRTASAVVPRRSRVRGDRRGGGRGASSATAAPGSSSSTAGSADVPTATGHGRRGVPARPRRAARGHALDDRLPRAIAAAWDPATWDADQERAARAAVVETPAGRLVSATRPHALEACVRTMFAYRPAESSPGSRRRSSPSGGSRPATRTRPASASPSRPASRVDRRCRAGPQPAALPAGRGHGGDPRPLGFRACASSTARPISPTTP